MVGTYTAQSPEPNHGRLGTLEAPSAPRPSIGGLGLHIPVSPNGHCGASPPSRRDLSIAKSAFYVELPPAVSLKGARRRLHLCAIAADRIYSYPSATHRRLLPRTSVAKRSLAPSNRSPSRVTAAMATLQGRRVFKVFNQDFIVDERYTVTKELGQGAYGIVWCDHSSHHCSLVPSQPLLHLRPFKPSLPADSPSPPAPP